MEQEAREGARRSSISGLGRFCCWSEDSGSSSQSSRPPPLLSTRHSCQHSWLFYLCVHPGGRTCHITDTLLGRGHQDPTRTPWRHLQHHPPVCCLSPSPFSSPPSSLCPTQHTQGHTAKISRCIQPETWLSP